MNKPFGILLMLMIAMMVLVSGCVSKTGNADSAPEKKEAESTPVKVAPRLIPDNMKPYSITYWQTTVGQSSRANNNCQVQTYVSGEYGPVLQSTESFHPPEDPTATCCLSDEQCKGAGANGANWVCTGTGSACGGYGTGATGEQCKTCAAPVTADQICAADGAPACGEKSKCKDNEVPKKGALCLKGLVDWYCWTCESVNLNAQIMDATFERNGIFASLDVQQQVTLATLAGMPVGDFYMLSSEEQLSQYNALTQEEKATIGLSEEQVALLDSRESASEENAPAPEQEPDQQTTP